MAVGRRPHKGMVVVRDARENLRRRRSSVVVSVGDASADEDTVRFRVWFRFVKYFKGEKRGKKRSSLEYGPETTNTETSVFRKEGGKWKPTLVILRTNRAATCAKVCCSSRCAGGSQACQPARNACAGSSQAE